MYIICEAYMSELSVEIWVSPGIEVELSFQIIKNKNKNCYLVSIVGISMVKHCLFLYYLCAWLIV